jgi:hypothetical protein
MTKLSGRSSADRHCENFGRGRTCSDIASEDRIRPRVYVVADGDAANNDRTTADPGLATDDDGGAPTVRASHREVGERSWFESRLLAYSPCIVPEPIVLLDMGTR